MTPILVAHFQGRFDRFRSGVRKKNVIQRRARQPRQLFRQLNRRHMRKPQQCRMRKFLELLANRIFNRLRPAAERQAPVPAIRIEKFPAVNVDQPIALRALDDRRRGQLVRIAFHLREGMPQRRLIHGAHFAFVHFRRGSNSSAPTARVPPRAGIRSPSFRVCLPAECAVSKAFFRRRKRR